ncbi:MAG: CRISPR-associated helicase Cas3' [Candidatus Hinthialibacter antarcticus]|nr:CRISPR-associated helicase Cas3' [Candidatus Hinthialibacter antarcticus]
MNTFDIDLFSLWAKTTDDEEFHSLILHLIDSAAVGLQLAHSERLRPDVQHWAHQTNTNIEYAPHWLSFITALHDIGKLNPYFQCMDCAPRQTQDFLIQQNAYQTLSSSSNDRLPHGFVSAAVLPECLDGLLASCKRDSLRQIQFILGGHHGVFPRPGDINNTSRHLKAKEDRAKIWSDARIQVTQCLFDIIHPQDNWPTLTKEDNASAFWLAGFVCLADWIASNSIFFGYQPDCDNLEDYWKQSNQKAKDALNKIRWTGYSLEKQPVIFQSLFSFSPRPLQEKIQSRAKDATKSQPRFAIIESPMGEGKTEAALFLHEYWRNERDQSGVYFALPTMAASNQLYSRTEEFLRRRHPGQEFYNLLLHSHVLLNDDYHTMRAAAIQQDGDNHSGVAAMDWFSQPKRGLLAPFAVGTVDQALTSVLQVRHGFLRLFGLAGKTIIFDEVHAYDAYMFTLFERLLQWLSALNCTVVILSATLPAKTREKMIAAFGAKKLESPNETPYPRVTLTTEDNQVECIHVPASQERKSVVRLKWVEDEYGEICDCLKTALREGGCAVYICNTVTRAQEVYCHCKQSFIDDEIELGLFHARFPMGKRFELETKFVTQFGKRRETRPKKSVLIATQVVEQSLDLDFDFMMTDMAPVDLILQRSGRLHRHKQYAKKRPKPLREPTLCIVKPNDSTDGPVFSAKFYDEYIMLRSWCALRDRTTIASPGDFESLIESVYGDLSEDADDRLRDAKVRSEEKINEHKSIANGITIKKPSSKNALSSWNRELDEDNPDVHHSLRADTRLTSPSLQIVCLASEDEKKLPQEGKARSEKVKQLISSSVSLSYFGCTNDLPEGLIPNEWKTHRILRHYRAVVFENSIYDADIKQLEYDPELGITIKNMIKEKEDGVF